MKFLLENWREYLKENVSTSLVLQAFKDTPSDYLEASVKQRNPGAGSAGSTFSSPISVEELVSANWAPYNHPDIESPAIAFKAPISGQLGIADIDSLPDDQPVRFQAAHAGKATVKDKDSPDFGQQTAEVTASIPEGNRTVQHTTLILGPSQEDASKLRVWTFFPGDPTGKFPDITMNSVRGKFNTEDEVVTGTIFDAKKMGYKFVKHVEGVE